MNSPRFVPAGLLIQCGTRRVAIDGVPGAQPDGDVDAWLVTDEHAELRAALRRLARSRGAATPAWANTQRASRTSAGLACHGRRATPAVRRLGSRQAYLLEC